MHAMPWFDHLPAFFFNTPCVNNGQGSHLD